MILSKLFKIFISQHGIGAVVGAGFRTFIDLPSNLANGGYGIGIELECFGGVDGDTNLSTKFIMILKFVPGNILTVIIQYLIWNYQPSFKF